MKWMEPLMVELAGLLRLQAAVPILVEKLHQDDDILASNCEKALIRIGSDEAVTAIAEQFPAADRHFKLYSTGVMEDIHSDLAADQCVSFLVQEKERFIQRRLADAALSHFAYGAIEPVRQIVRTQRLDGELCTLRDYLVETCKIMGEQFPEYDQWKSAGEREREEHFRQLAEVSGDPQRMLLFAMQKLKGLPFPRRRRERTAAQATCEAIEHGNGGRNWPWPCRGHRPRQGHSARRQK